VERPPRLVLSSVCPEHGRIVRPRVGPDELVWMLEAGATVRWPDLHTAALCTALLTCGSIVPTLVVDLDAHTVFSNPAWSALTGLSTAASRGQRWLSALTNEGPGTLMGAVRGDTAVDVTISIGGHQRTRWMLAPQPLLGARGRPLGHLVVLLGAASRSSFGHGAGSVTRSWHRGSSAADARHDLVARVGKALERQTGEHGTVALTLVQIEQIPATELTVSDGGRPRFVPKEAIPLTDGELLRRLAARLIDLSRPGDIAFDLGGGRFALLCEEATSYAETAEVAQRLADEAGEPLEAEPQAPSMRASVGIAFPHLPNETAEDVMVNAERAVDAARSLGGNRFEVVIGTGPGSSDVAPA
jgi:hypothetical protein